MTHVVRWRVFALAAVAINLVAFLMVRVTPRPAVEVGAALDVAVTMPALYFLLIVRGGVLPVMSMLPVCLLGMQRATYLAPGISWARPAVGAGVERERRGEMRVAGTSGEPAECGAAAFGSGQGAGGVRDDAPGVEHCTGGGRSRRFRSGADGERRLKAGCSQDWLPHW